MSESLYFYEQPLNERMRAFLRLEHLFNNIRSQISLDAEWASRGALSGIIDLTSLLTRAEIKGELIKELERNLHTFEALARDPRVDAQALTDATGGIQAILSGLKSQDGAFGYELKSNELINSVKQRSAIPAGTCDFDVPALHYWLHLDGTQRCARSDTLVQRVRARARCRRVVSVVSTKKRDRHTGGGEQRTIPKDAGPQSTLPIGTRRYRRERAMLYRDQCWQTPLYHSL